MAEPQDGRADDSLPDRRDERRGGRLPAGTDGRKRRQILDGASAVFKRLGYDAASVNDVARAAGVSKATLYVYYQNKEQLFAAVIGEERDRNIDHILAVLDPERPVEEALGDLGRELLRAITQPWVIQAHRVVIGVVARMPEIGREFYAGGSQRVIQAVAGFLARHVGAGHLEVPDTTLAAAQFLELCQATVMRPRLYAVVEEPPDDATRARVIASAVEMFMARYGRKACG